MRCLTLLCLAAGTLFVSLPEANAANQRSWVASTGLDANACTRAAPCATLSAALANTVDGGSINCADSGTFVDPAAGLTITQGVEIDCRSQNALAEITGSTGIVINVADPTTQSVTIRGLVVNGRVNNSRANARGIWIQAAKSVSITDSLIEQFQQQGVIDTRAITASTTLFMRNTSVAGNSSAGIVLVMTGGNSSGINANVIMENVSSEFNLYGIAVGANNRVRMIGGIFTNNTNQLEADGGGRIVADGVLMSFTSGTAVIAGGQISLANCDISFSGTVFNGNVLSYGNNRVDNFTSLGTTPTFIGSSTTDHGQM